MAEHRHRFAGWCAASAAASSTKCRFSVHNGVRLIEKVELKEIAESWDALPAPDVFDTAHREWRDSMVMQAPSLIGRGKGRAFTHGVAAKLINCYLKPIFVTGIVSDQQSLSPRHLSKLNAIHPPIDRLLLAVLIRKDYGGKKSEWKDAQRVGWSAFSSEEYEQVIRAVQQSTPDGLWRIEECWEGYQSAIRALMDRTLTGSN